MRQVGGNHAIYFQGYLGIIVHLLGRNPIVSVAVSMLGPKLRRHRSKRPQLKKIVGVTIQTTPGWLLMVGDYILN